MKPKPFDFEKALQGVAADANGVAGRLLRAAIGEFAKGGVASARTQAIAEAAGVSVGSLHFHWRDKQTLYEAACLSASRQYALALGAALSVAPPDGSAALGVIDRFVGAIVDVLAAQPELPRLLLYRMASREPIGDAPRHVADMRLMEEALRARFPGCASGDVDAPMLILMTYFGALTMFASSDVQALYLGMSPADEAFRRRFKAFVTQHLKRVLI